MILYKGDDWEIPFRYKTGKGDVFPIDNISQILSCFKGDSSTEISVTLTDNEISIDSAASGTGKIVVPASKTATIKKGIQPLTVIRTNNAGKEFTSVIEDLLDIRERPCG